MKYTKIMLFIPICILLISCEKTTGWDFKNLKGQPKSVTTTESDYKLVNGDWQKGDWQHISVSEEIIFNKKGIIEKEKTFLDNKLRREYSYQYSDNEAKRTEYDFKEKSNKSEELFIISKPYFKVSSIQSKDLQTGKIFYDRDYEWKDNIVVKEVGATRDTNHLNKITEYTYSKDGMVELRKEIFLYDDKPNEQIDWEYVNYELDEYENWISRIKINPYNATLGTKEQRIIIYF